jgi:surface polysaccharide O-acyltransferase-like enzyme
MAGDIEATPPQRVLRADVELMRVIAIGMVVAIHVAAPTIISAERAHQQGAAYWVALIASETSRAGVPIFFAIMGWALLRRTTPGDLAWLGQRVARLGIPLVAWSTLKIASVVMLANADGIQPWAHGRELEWVGANVSRVLSGPGPGSTLWFVYYAIALTVAIWLIRSAAFTKEPQRPAYIAIALALIAVFGLAAAFRVTLSWQTFGWALGYVAIGYAIIEGPSRPRLGVVVFVAGAAATVTAIAALGYNTWPLLYVSPTVILTTLGALWLMNRATLPARLEPLIVRLGALTFGVYLAHPLVLAGLRLTARPGGPLGGLPATVVFVLTWIVVVVVSFAIVALWHRSRLLVRILG